jgi:Hg(II)-responsive transcriptional regulator
MHGRREKGSLRIGQVAEAADVHIETLRYYERKGLLPLPPRTLSNYRLYPEDTVLRVRFIKRAQELGFTLVEIRDLLELRMEKGADCAVVCERAREKVREIEGKIRSLQSMKRSLSKLERDCKGSGPLSECSILEAMQHGTKKADRKPAKK